jgi:hypothetical protein
MINISFFFYFVRNSCKNFCINRCKKEEILGNIGKNLMWLFYNNCYSSIIFSFIFSFDNFYSTNLFR